MVCKEDVLLWFKDLESYKRIDVLYELLNMCLPFELRFLGSCVEEIGKHTYQELRGPAINANDLEKLSKDTFFNQGILDENVRHRVLICLSLLSSRNYSVANWLYKTLLRTDWIEDYIVKGNIKDENVQSEFLLLFVMALHHPAFTFEQKLFYGKIVSHLIDIKDSSKNRLSPKPSPYGYPPGFGYPTIKTICSEGPSIPVKLPSAMPCGDEIVHQQSQGLVHGPPPQSHQEFVAWSRPGFPCGAPESLPPPFPASNLSPLVSQSTSPIHSRSNSPNRSVPMALRTAPMQQQQQQQPPPPPPPQCDVHPVTTLPPPPPPPSVDQLSSNSFPPFMYPSETQIKVPTQDDELNSIPEEKLVGDVPWLPKDVKQPNGLRFQSCKAQQQQQQQQQRPYIIDQIQTLSLDGDCLHRSNSSSNSSLNQTPPETPTTRPDKSRCNGMPFVTAPTMCEHTSPPPPPPPSFNNCSVPYTTYPTFTALPAARFPYTQSYRPPFTAHFPSYQTNDNSFPTYSFPYMSIIYSSPQQYPPRNPNCFNCGATGHLGQDCTGQNIEDITQKKTYTLEFTTPLPDADK